ncbi:helix-turn-helix transcriptional regulator [Lentimicrobium sp. S6]|uniref:helix-turn-helix domain-containing protein n=1 Tax=Lentimicrobium sp. S6 TaxID=2735872 RepID=UPI0015526190|nr:helix-turn-helix transcriptional regulator [Lentimicrobium sp. S6]NPD48069.1 helix-turn-helix domain-containing protein [Lentimicrobium sp. S6]
MDIIILNIKALLKKNKLTQAEFAEMIDKTPQTVFNYFSGRSKLDVDTLYLMAESLNVDIREFFDTNINSSSQTKHSIKQSQKGTGNIINTGNFNQDKYNKVEIKLKREVESLKKDLKQLKTEVKGLEKEVELKDRIIGLLEK